MKSLIFLTCCICFNAAAISQSLQGVRDETYPLRPGILSLSANSQSTSCNSVYKSDLCLSSVNTETFYEFMDWLKDKVHYPGMQAGILHDGELVWKGNWGLSSIEENKPVTDSTVFRLLSVSKTFVGTAVMQLVEDGLIDLNGDINDHLPFDVINPYYPQSIVTPKMVLCHNASIADFCAGSGPECNTTEYLGDPLVSLHDYMESHFVPGGICYDDMSYYNEPPGTYCYYSNPGAALGGYIVESVTGKGFNEYCNDSIFGLLEMPTSRWYYSELDTAIVAKMYDWNGSYYNTGARSYVGYPLGDLKSNATQLANFVKMYINHGNYNGISLLDSTTVEMMTTINDTLLPWGAPIGMIWWYDPLLNLWYHDGATGSCIAFNKDEKTGFVFADNSRTGRGEANLICAHFQAIFSELVISSVHTVDTDGDGILETGETVEIVTGAFNNMIEDAEDVSLTLRCSDPAFVIIDSVATLGNIPAGQSVLNQSQPFQFQVSGIQDPHTVMMDVEVNFNDDETILVHFPLFAGQADLLLVKDERDVLNSERYYLDVLDSLLVKTHYWDIAVNGNPDTSFLNNFPAVIWYTGYDQDSTVSEANQHSLMHYLDGGGNLFMTGQNISDEIGNSDFMQNYLHASHNTNVTLYIVFGVDGDPIGDGVSFYMNNKNPFMPNQYSRSAVNALNGGIACFNYGYYNAGVRFENDIYKTVFLGFGFEAIDTIPNRYELMKRILDYFGFSVGEHELAEASHSELEIRLMPNPADEQISVSWPVTNSFNHLTIIDLSGREILTLYSASQPVVIDISDLPQGIYFLRVTNDSSVGVGKFLKQ